MIAISDVVFGFGMLAVFVLVAVIYVAVGDRVVPAPQFSKRSNMRLVEPPPFFDWAIDDDEMNADLTPSRGRPRPSVDDWLRSELSTG